MGTKKSDCVAMFPESIEKVQKSMPKDCEIDKVVSFFKVLADDTRIRILHALKEQCRSGEHRRHLYRKRGQPGLPGRL